MLEFVMKDHILSKFNSTLVINTNKKYKDGVAKSFQPQGFISAMTQGTIHELIAGVCNRRFFTATSRY